ncbi:MAG TPA: hypothetical protein PK252_05240 [Bacteroidales bacterium]|nr:hypothetical protein [Bacteroidales bacterium]
MTTKRNILNALGLVGVAIFISLASCQSSNNPQGTATSDSLNKNEITENVEAIVYPLPSPFEMTKMLNEIGAAYLVKNLNAPNKVEKYLTEKDKAINLGVYGADLAYASTYNKEQDIKIYLEPVKALIDDLGIKVDYSPLIDENLKAKLNNKDSLVKVVTNTIYETYSFLNKQNKPELSAMLVSGMWIELMYIATHISKDTYNNTQIVDIVSKQSESYNKLMELLGRYNNNKDINDIQQKLMVLKPAFDKVKSGLTEQDYSLILNTVEAVRKTFVM